MKKFLRLLSLLLIVSSFMVSAPSLASDLEVSTVKNVRLKAGERILSKQENMEYLAGLSKEEKQIILAKEKLALSLEKSNNRKSGSLISLSGSFTLFIQENDAYCVPATIKSILGYINGTSPSQSDIADAIGTSLIIGTSPTTIAPYLNENQNRNYYVYQPNYDMGINTMCSRIYSAISYSHVPASIGIDTTSTSWFYHISGHSTAVIGIYDDYSKIKLADPAGGLIPGCPSFYIKDASTVYNCCTRLVW